MAFLGELEKMIITIVDKDGVEKGESIKLLINPEGYKESYTVEYNEDQENNSGGKKPKFYKVKPGNFTFKLLYDSTGIFEVVDLDLKETLTSIADDISGFIPFQDDEAENNNIVEEINKIKELVAYQGDIHKTYELRINWGALELKCILTKLDIDYKLFNPQGFPIRAVATLTCKQNTSEVLRLAKEKKSSPDLTHIRTVKEGDTLPLMTYRIYGDSKYYLEVARANNLLNFRSLEPGTELIFPPLDKTQSA
ncbi:CIS tube protein [Kordia jejudonensis]|uniref:CIS tube protein n=1 Tax=Kordia jejudonensis TaxID=1348245 RepID=UPI0006290058|nr:hypothetical protein [Kordia jejudonensis]